MWVAAAGVSVLLAALLAISVIDWEHRIIPDAISKPGIVLGILTAPLWPLHDAHWFPGMKPGLQALLQAGAGALLGGGIILVVRWLGRLVFRKEAMGLGDAKLLAMIGAFAGPLGALYALILGSLTGAVAGMALLFVGRRRAPRCAVVVDGPTGRLEVREARVRPDALELDVPEGGEAGAAVRLEATLPAAKILEDEDARVRWSGRIASVREGRAARVWRVELADLSDEDEERYALLAQSYRYVPFGPFLSLGGAAVLLYRDSVHWLVTEGYPSWVRGLL
jgi:prepilin signal peptidase PulO-like enzyme (type II secretory pathway)